MTDDDRKANVSQASRDLFEAGYDQAIREVLSEVRRCNDSLYRDIVAQYPAWRTVMRRLP